MVYDKPRQLCLRANRGRFLHITANMKKLILAALALTFATSAFAAPPRSCRAWRHDSHHHRVCARWR